MLGKVYGRLKLRAGNAFGVSPGGKEMLVVFSVRECVLSVENRTWKAEEWFLPEIGICELLGGSVHVYSYQPQAATVNVPLLHLYCTCRSARQMPTTAGTLICTVIVREKSKSPSSFSLICVKCLLPKL
jgi:hypothetical protein